MTLEIREVRDVVPNNDHIYLNFGHLQRETLAECLPAELVKPSSPPAKLPAEVGDTSIARMDKTRNSKGHIPTVELRRELQVSV